MICPISRVVIVCLFMILSATVEAVFNPFDPNQEENFNPALADPKGSVTCFGESYDLNLPSWDGFNPNELSMQQLCAKTQYGGAPPGQNVGAYCYYLNATDPCPRVMFDPTPEAQANAHFANPRVLLGCAYRCFCNYGLNNTDIQPVEHPGIHEFHMASEETYMLQIDVNDETEPPFYTKQGPFGSDRVKAVGLDSRPERRGHQFDPGHQEPWLWTEISVDPENEIVCHGDLPTFDIPFPFTRHSFRNVQHLCATQFFYGNGNANAGAYCHRSDTPQGRKNTVAFSDEMTPRYDWTWGGGNLRFVGSLRWHCSRVCKCYVDPTNYDNFTNGMWNILEGLGILDQDQSLYLISKATERRITLLPPQKGTNPPSGTCGPSGTQFCPLDWDFKAWGPTPDAPVGASDIIKPKAPNTNMTVCGNKCHQPSDCGSTTDKYSCSCAIPTMTDIRTLGLDPIAPVAICIALFASSVKSNSLIGRNAPKYTDYFQTPHTCVCNATHVSDECCVPNMKIQSSVMPKRSLKYEGWRLPKPYKVRRSLTSQHRVS